MPAKFDACVAQGGRVRTIKLGGRKYKHVSFAGGKSYAGHTKTKKKE